jgi:hypothetical protein
MLFTAEVLFITGLLLVVGSIVLLGIAQRIRAWFFPPDPAVELRAIRIRADK